MGVLALKPVAQLIVALRDWSLKSSARNVAIGELMARRLEARDIGKVSVIANWCDDENITPVARDANSLRAEWGLSGKFVIGYSGNFGRAHEYETLLSAARSEGWYSATVAGSPSNPATAKLWPMRYER